MSEQKQNKKSFSVDWLARGVLTKIGEIADTFTGRSPNKTSSLATSEIVERLKKMLDSEVEDLGVKGKFVPHHIKLKMAWDKFSTDSPEALQSVENELVVAAIDHINDNRYHLHAPLKVSVKADYFTEGVQLVTSFDKFSAEEKEVEVNVTLPNAKTNQFIPANLNELPIEENIEVMIAEFTSNSKPKQQELKFEIGKRLSVGRTNESDLTIEDATISKNHASLAINSEGKFIVADTGSTNGTFINGNRLAYGRAFPINEGDKVLFGTVEVYFRRVAKPTEFVENVAVEDEIPPTQAGIKIDLIND
jgi:pSer/pThr/pTyr-binding forkhead associated (FHA) protein